MLNLPWLEFTVKKGYKRLSVYLVESLTDVNMETELVFVLNLFYFK